MKIADEPFQRVKKEMVRLIPLRDNPYPLMLALDKAAGKALISVTSQILQETYTGVAATEECQKWVTGSMCECLLSQFKFVQLSSGLLSDAAGTDTIHSTLRCFLFAMVMNPEVQKRAQAEIDSLTESQRLPTLDEYVVSWGIQVSDLSRS